MYLFFDCYQYMYVCLCVFVCVCGNYFYFTLVFIGGLPLESK